MNIIECPMCHDSDAVETLADGEKVDWKCPTCNCQFVVTASIFVDYSVSCKEEDHKWQEHHKTGCEQCGRCHKVRKKAVEAGMP